MTVRQSFNNRLLSVSLERSDDYYRSEWHLKSKIPAKNKRKRVKFRVREFCSRASLKQAYVKHSRDNSMWVKISGMQNSLPRNSGATIRWRKYYDYMVINR